MNHVEGHAVRWKTSSSCADAACVEVAAGAGRFMIRNNQDEGVVLTFGPMQWSAFVAGAKRGEFD